MNEIKKVDFEGAELLAIKDEESGKVYASVNNIAKSIGLSEDQCKKQGRNVQEDFVLKTGCKMLSAKFDTQVRNVICIELDYLPLWLAKISITPKMIEEKPEVAHNLAEYQLKAKDVLAKVFIHKEEITKEDLLILGIVKSKTSTEQAVAIKEYGDYVKAKVVEEQVKPLEEKNNVLQLENKQQEQVIKEYKPKASYYDIVLKSNGTMSITQIAKDFGLSGKALNQKLHELGVQYKQSGTWLLYSKYQDKGYTKSETYVDQTGTSRLNTKWLQTGRLFIYDLLKQNGILPLIEREDNE